MSKISTKATILLCARKLFIENGFAGTSTLQIAKNAEVSHALLFHHFFNKENLWQQVKQNIVKESNEQAPTLPDTSLPLVEFLKKLVYNSIKFYRNNPDIVRMLNWQRLESSTGQMGSLEISAESKTWIAAFKHYQKLGAITSTIKAKFLVLFILSLTSSATLDQNIFLNDKKEFNAYIEFCLDSIKKIFIQI